MNCVDLGLWDSDIRENADPLRGEIAAGWLYRKSKRSQLKKHLGNSSGSGISSEFSHKPTWGVVVGWPSCVLIEYDDQRKTTKRKVTFLLKCSVRTKGLCEGLYHISVRHGSRGSEHVFCKTERGMKSWEAVLTEVVTEAAAKGGIEGYLKKR